MMGISDLYLHLTYAGPIKITKENENGDRILIPYHDKVVTTQLPYFAAAFREAVFTFFKVKHIPVKNALVKYMKETLEESLVLKELSKSDFTAWSTIMWNKDYAFYLKQLESH